MYVVFKHSYFNKIAFSWALLLTLILFYSFFESVGLFAALGLFFVGLLLFNLGVLLSRQVSLPHIMLFNYFFQHLIAALILYKYPPVPLYNISHYQFPFYLSYAVPCCIALYLGVTLATKNIKGIIFKPENVHIDLPVWASNGKHLYWFGFVVIIASPYLKGFSSISFVIVLASSLAYVGLFTLILSDNKKWLRYALLLFFYELITSVQSGFFHDLILWGGALFLVLSYRYRWRMKSYLILFLALSSLFLLQSVKEQYRQQSLQDSNPSIISRIELLGDLLTSKKVGGESPINSNSIAAVFVRFNQGWIVNRVMQHVPAAEPYAGGGTILKGLYAAVVPRIIDPDKPIAGGRLNFEKYTGLELTRQTSMSIGVTGEMYANFGLYGGVIGMAVYGYLIGQLFMLLYNKAQKNPVWWAWGPFVGLMAMKAEEGLMETTTWVIKSVVVMFLVVFVCNNFKRRHLPTRDVAVATIVNSGHDE